MLPPAVLSGGHGTAVGRGRDRAARVLAIDALAVARAALREPGLPLARLDGPERDIRLLVDYREALVAERTRAVNRLPSLLAVPGCAALTAAKIVGETAGIDRFHSKDAYARYNGTAPLPVWSSNRARHRLSRTGNRQLNAALHRIALAQAHWHPNARAFLNKRRANGDGGLEALRALKRRLSDVVYRALHDDLTIETDAAA